MNNNNDTVKLTPRSLSDFDGKFLDTDGYAYGAITQLLADKFNEIVIRQHDTGRNIWFYTASGYQVSSNGYVHKIITCDMTVEYDVYPDMKYFPKSAMKCGRPAKFKNPYPNMNVAYVCGIHARSLNKLYVRIGNLQHCIPLEIS
jgi:hypothetical protein